MPPPDPTPPGSRRAFLAAAAAAASTGAAPGGAAVNPRLFTFVGGDAGAWAVTSVTAVRGEGLPAAPRLNVVQGAAPAGGAWSLRGVTSNERYVTRAEKGQLVAAQAPLGRPSATRGALIPIRKKPEWWALTQDERRELFEGKSRHTAVGLKYLPAVARRLHHCRDLGESEPFDFLTFFDFAPADAAAFDDLLAALRSTEEWKYVDREVDVRLERGVR